MNPPTPDALQSAMRIIMDSIAVENSAEYSSGDVNASFLDSVDRDIKAMELAMESLNSAFRPRLSALRKQHNLLIPIARLPTEVLGVIFEDVIDSVDRDPSDFLPRDENDRLQYDRLQELSTVCTYWRGVSNSSANLWKNLTSTLPRGLINVILSKRSPLHITWNAERGNLDFTEVCSAIQRWRKFASSECTIAMLDSMSQLSFAPELRVLALRKSLDEWGEAYPQDLLGGVAPHLKSLDLCSIPLPWDSGLLGGLRELKLSRMGRFSPSVSELRAVASNNPNLRTLYIERCNPKVHEDMASAENPVVVLPNLAVLCLVDVPMDAVRTLLHSVHAPALDRLCIRAIRCNHLGLGALFGGSGDPLRGWLHANLKTAATISISLGDDKKFRLIVRGDVADHLQDNIEIELRTQVAIHPSLQALASAMPLSTGNRRILALSSTQDLRDEQLFSLLASISGITVLKLAGRSLDFRPFLRRLTHPTLAVDGVQRFVFPLLTELNLRNGRISPRELWDLIRIRDSAASPAAEMPKRIEVMNLRCTVPRLDAESEAGIRSLIPVQNLRVEYLFRDDEDTVLFMSDSDD